MPKADISALLSDEHLLDEIRQFAEDVAGMYVPTSDMQRFYFEVAEQKGWQPKHWGVIGRELGRITEKCTKKLEDGRKVVVYMIPGQIKLTA